MSGKLPTEKQARKKVELIEKETGIKYKKKQKEEAIRQLMGKRPWFE